MLCHHIKKIYNRFIILDNYQNHLKKYDVRNVCKFETNSTFAI
jgi:hypothetical protein